MRRTIRALLSVLMAALLAAQIATGVAAQEASPEPVGSLDPVAGAEWLMSQQNDDGGFPGLGGESGPAFTVDAVIALAAAGQEGVEVAESVDNAMAYLESEDHALVFAQTGQGQAAKLVLAAVAAGADPRDIAGVDALALIEKAPSSDLGLYGSGVFDHALVLLALAATGTDVPEEAVSAIEETRAPEGGWAFDGSTAEGFADSNTTALVVQALVAIGEQDADLVADGLAFLQTALDATSGALYQPGSDFPPDAVSTAYVLQAVIATGEDPASDEWGNLPAALASFQKPSGAFFFNADDPADNLFASAQAIPAAAGVALPVLPGEVALHARLLAFTESRAA